MRPVETLALEALGHTYLQVKGTSSRMRAGVRDLIHGCEPESGSTKRGTYALAQNGEPGQDCRTRRVRSFEQATRLRGILVRRYSEFVGGGAVDQIHAGGSVLEVEGFPLSVLDEIILTLDDPLEPWGIHIEAHLDGDLDEARIREACHSVLEIHPLAGARLRTAGRNDRDYFWARAPVSDRAPFEVNSVGCSDELDMVREQCLATTVDIRTSPTFDVTYQLSLVCKPT